MKLPELLLTLFVSYPGVSANLTRMLTALGLSLRLSQVKALGLPRRWSPINTSYLQGQDLTLILKPLRCLNQRNGPTAPYSIDDDR
jgi:hypothetical protein